MNNPIELSTLITTKNTIKIAVLLSILYTRNSYNLILNYIEGTIYIINAEYLNKIYTN